MEKHTLLVEIGTEDLPSKGFCQLGEALVKNIKIGFNKTHVVYEKVVWFASFRRLAITILNVLVDYRIYNNRNAINLFNDNDEILCNQCFLYGKKNDILLLSDIINSALMALPNLTMMRWLDKDMKFIRPVRTISVLLGSKLILCNLFGITSSRVIRGLRFIGKKEIILDDAKNYQKVLLKHNCVIDYERRKNIIYCGVENIVKDIGGKVDYSGGLLEEITALSECPIVVFGSFDKKFLCIPDEVLLHVMKIKKRYFPIYGFNGKLLPFFIFVIDVAVKNNKKIIVSHEEVLRSCFSDAVFFLNYDNKYRLEDYLLRLHTIMFHRELGTMYDKTIRMKCLSSWIATKINANIYQAERAAMLSKCDLLSYMVYEFPFAQGIIGMYYARRDGELEEVALAQKEQYYPRFSSDVLPNHQISCIVAIADKIDTLSGMFMIGEYPKKGSGDPMGVRRAAIGILRIILEKKIAISLSSLIKYSLVLYKNISNEELFVNKVISFMYRRLCVLYEKKGYHLNIIRATLDEKLVNLVDFDDRIQAVSSFYLLQEFQLLLRMYKRIFNILILEYNVEIFEKCDVKDSFLVNTEEIILSEKVDIVNKRLVVLYKMGCYYDALCLLVTLSTSVDDFFNSVQVMSENEDHRLNRLLLLNKIWCLLLPIINTPSFLFKRSFFRNKLVI